MTIDREWFESKIEFPQTYATRWPHAAIKSRYVPRGQRAIVAVLDYTGRPTAASVTVTEHRAGDGTFERAPYYIDLNSGRTLQFLGPIFSNGTYDVRFSYHYEQGNEKTTSATLTLDRSCQ